MRMTPDRGQATISGGRRGGHPLQLRNKTALASAGLPMIGVLSAAQPFFGDNKLWFWRKLSVSCPSAAVVWPKQLTGPERIGLIIEVLRYKRT